jgi:GNAT superfamily N-acetyltransferase
MPTEALSERQRATWRRMLATEGLTVYVAELGADVVGTVSALVMPNLGYGCRPSAFVEAMVVAEAHRRRGIGRMLVESVLRDLRDASCDKIQLLTHKRHADDGAHDFYRALGFEPEAEGFRRYLVSRAPSDTPGNA